MVEYPAEFEEKIKSGKGRYVSSNFEAVEMEMVSTQASSVAKWEKEMISAEKENREMAL